MRYGFVFVTALICYLAEPIANWLQVFDYPRGGRKHHFTPTPQVGGVAILLPLMIFLAEQLFFGAISPFKTVLLLCGGALGVVGVMDDQSQLSPAGRILLLAIFVLLAFSLDPELIVRTVSWASFQATPLPAWLFSAIAVTAITGFVSSVNMADGIDGLMPAAMLIWCLGFDLLTRGEAREISLFLTGCLVIVLGFNLRGKLFLGDCGTFGVGFIIALLAVAALARHSIPAETILVWFFLPVIDCLRVVATRLKAGRSPLKGGKDHFHHLLAQVFGKKRAFYVYASSILVTSALAAVVPRSGMFLLVGMTAMCLGFAISKKALEDRRTTKLPLPLTRVPGERHPG